MGVRLGKVAGLLFAGAAVGILLASERARPLRQRTRAELPRLARNGAMGAACQAVIMVSDGPITQTIARENARSRRGLQHAIGGLPGRIAAFLLMDYIYYLWHVATHKVPFLWRFHRVHHVDPDLDASTAIRFHALDMLISVPMRMVQVRLAGVDPATHDAWRSFFLGSVLFHHSNLRLPEGVDERLSTLLTTPRMHGIHHSQRPDEMDANWSSGISLWDRLHGTFRADVAQQAIAIGVDDPLAERDIALLPALQAPFQTSGNRDEFTAS
ncbi:sterol desaturase family protein [Aurantiacibacter poecillastricola]|uniref:sterol desaturase family protein n=1 Tax=Aurantiacibacter poecillastricola TaxID=3064385 RepID=UPI00273D3B9E|nr:sterol desaturase family protein [Aurantiacibacter sp. 219JJ12-13]MDP5261099.1 sterol desaturase family protein [Aurantiacibacter sp. 219JJ12-13]